MSKQRKQKEHVVLPADSRRDAHTVILPSKGWFYPGCDKETVEIYEMTTQEEKILAQPKARAFDIIYELVRRLMAPSNWVQPDPANNIVGFQYDNLLMSDHYFIFLMIRAISIDDVYGFDVTCPACNAKFRQELSIPNDLPVREPESQEECQEPFDVELTNGDMAHVRLLRVGDERQVQRRTKMTLRRNVSRGDAAIGMRMTHQLVGTNGGVFETLLDAQNYYDSLKFKDAQLIREAIVEHDPGVLPELEFACPECGEDFESMLPTSPEFFRPKRRTEAPRHY